MRQRMGKLRASAGPSAGRFPVVLQLRQPKLKTAWEEHGWQLNGVTEALMGKKERVGTGWCELVAKWLVVVGV